YGETFAGQMRGTPATVFNGKPRGGGGGSMAFAEKKYAAYRAIIDPLLEQPAGARLSAQATRAGDRIAIKAEVSGLTEPGARKKLRLLLVEENVRYVGGNKLRFHHQVVRAMPGGVDGFAL